MTGTEETPAAYSCRMKELEEEAVLLLHGDEENPGPVGSPNTAALWDARDGRRWPKRIISSASALESEPLHKPSLSTSSEDGRGLDLLEQVCLPSTHIPCSK